MQRKQFDKEQLGQTEDWQGNNVAVACPHCANVFLASGNQHRNGRRCPSCEKTHLYCDIKGNQAWMEW